MKITNSHIWKTAVSVGISALVIVYVYVNRVSIFGAFAHLEPAYLAAVFAGQIGIQVANACLLQTLLRPFGKSIGWLEAFKLTTVSSFVNFFTPVVGGASLRAVYLKRVHDLSYASFVSVLYANYLIVFIVSFTIGMIGLVGIPGAFSEPAGQVAALFFVCGIVASLSFMLFGHMLLRAFQLLPQNNRYVQSLTHKANQVEAGWGLIRHDGRTILTMGIWSALLTFCGAIIYWSAMHSLSMHGSVWVALIFSSLSIIGLLFNITPGSVGIREAVYASMYGVTKLTLKQVVAFSLVDRPAQLLVICIGWMLFGRSILGAAADKPVRS